MIWKGIIWNRKWKLDGKIYKLKMVDPPEKEDMKLIFSLDIGIMQRVNVINDKLLNWGLSSLE